MSYTPPQIPLSLKVANPKLKDVLDALKTDIFQSLNCHAVGTINSVTQNANVHGGLLTVNVSVNYTKQWWQLQPNGNYASFNSEYPQLIDCPLVVMGGGNANINFPVGVGDQCLVFFNDRDLNNWMYQPLAGFSGPPASTRKHSISDAIAMVGFKKITNYDPTHAQFTNGNAVVGIANDSGNGLIKIANNTTSLGAVLSTFFSAISSPTVTTVEIAAAAVIANTQISELLS